MAVVSNEDCLTKKLIEDVHSTFTRLETALKSRETQLLRQIDVILQQYKHSTGNMKGFNKINVVFENEIEILKAVSNFGIIDFEGVSFENNIYKIEDYENPNCDHVCMHKCLMKVHNVPDIIPSPQKDDTGIPYEREIKFPTLPDHTSSQTNMNKKPADLPFLKEELPTDSQKTSPEMIVKNLHLYASTLKTLQSYEDLHNLECMSPIHIISCDFGAKALLSPSSSSEGSFTDVPNTSPRCQTSNNSLNSSNSASFEFHETTTFESPEDRTVSNSKQNLIFHQCNDTASDLSPICPTNASFEFHETIIDNSLELENKSTQSPRILNRSESTKHIYNRHDSRYAKISESSLAEYTEIEMQENTKAVLDNEIENNRNFQAQIEDNIVNANPQQGTINLNEKETVANMNKELIVRKISMEHPKQVQQWMQQIICEPETEPIHNTELLEHVNISTTL